MPPKPRQRRPGKRAAGSAGRSGKKASAKATRAAIEPPKKSGPKKSNAKQRVPAEGSGEAERAPRRLKDASSPIRTVPYEPELHFEQVLQWLRMRGESASPEALPKTGYIVPGVAAGFLYRTDSSIAWIDSLVASKERTREERSQALDAIVEALRQEARRAGFKSILGYTLQPVVVDRALRLGWEYVRGGYHLVVVKP